MTTIEQEAKNELTARAFETVRMEQSKQRLIGINEL